MQSLYNITESVKFHVKGDLQNIFVDYSHIYQAFEANIEFILK